MGFLGFLYRVLISTLTATLLNPHVYLDAVLLMGSLGAQQGVPGAYVLSVETGLPPWFLV